MTNDNSQVVETDTEPAVLTPLTRWIRTILQMIAAFVVAWPIAVNAFHDAADTVGARYAVLAAAMILFSALHNAWNARKAGTQLGRRARDRGQTDVLTILLIVVVVVVIVVVLTRL